MKQIVLAVSLLVMAGCSSSDMSGSFDWRSYAKGESFTQRNSDWTSSSSSWRPFSYKLEISSDANRIVHTRVFLSGPDDVSEYYFEKDAVFPKPSGRARMYADYTNLKADQNGFMMDIEVDDIKYSLVADIIWNGLFYTNIGFKK